MILLIGGECSCDLAMARSSLLLCLLLPAMADQRTTVSRQSEFGSSPGFNFTLPAYWACCRHQRVPGSASDPLVGLYRLYFGPLPQLLPQCR